MSTDQLSMSMFATRADYDEAVRAQHAADQVWLIADLEAIVSAPRGTDAQITKEREISAAAIDGALAFGYQGTEAPEAGHWLLSAHNAGKRIAELEAERDELRKELDCAEEAIDVAACSLTSEDCAGYECIGSYIRAVTQQLANERAELRAKYDELLVALRGIGAALGIPEGDRSPYSVTCGVLERVNRLAEIEAQEPVALVETSGDQGAGIGWSGAVQPVGAKLYARPVPAIPEGWKPVMYVLRSTATRPQPAVVTRQRYLSCAISDLVEIGLEHLDPLFTHPAPAQAVPDADGARFRWLCEDHSDRETRERCRSLIDRLPVMSYSDAVMSIDAAMAAAQEHKA